jgi:glycosyltransferase involved in cell wall biosynthesis
VQEGFNGHLVEPGNIDAIVEGMKKYLESDHQRLKSLSINTRAFAEEYFYINTQIDRHCIIYESVANH